jgi:hypothetical protein
MRSATDRPARSAKQRENGADDDERNTDRPQHLNASDKPDNKQYDAQNDH